MLTRADDLLAPWVDPCYTSDDKLLHCCQACLNCFSDSQLEESFVCFVVIDAEESDSEPTGGGDYDDASISVVLLLDVVDPAHMRRARNLVTKLFALMRPRSQPLSFPVCASDALPPLSALPLLLFVCFDATSAGLPPLQLCHLG